MKRWIALCCLAQLLSPSHILGDDDPKAVTDVQRIKRELLSTWDCVSIKDLPKEIGHIKHVTPTHYTLVTYDRDQKAILAITGGIWSFQDGKYREVCEFASDRYQHVRGKALTYSANIVGDKWDLKASPDAEIEVDEGWNRVKPGEDQKKNTEQPGPKLLGTWEKAMGPQDPETLRMVKHITPTHWTWVIYDRESKTVTAAMGGPWSLKDDKYEETVAFTTDDAAAARGKSFAFSFQVDGDRWLFRKGPGARGAIVEVWKRVK